MKRAGVSRRARSMRDAAGWMRWPSVSKDARDDLAVEHVAPCAGT